MRILQIGSYLDPDFPGGAEVSAQNYAQALQDRGHEIVRLRWRASDDKRITGKIYPVSPGQWEAATWRPYTPLETRPGLPKALFYGLELLAKLDDKGFAELLDREKIDLCLVHSFRGLGFDLVSKVANSGRPVLMALHDFALVCLNKGMARKGIFCGDLCTVCRGVAGRNGRALGKAKLLRFVAASRYLLETTEKGLGLANAEFHNIPNPNRYVMKPRVRNHHEPLGIGYVGRLEADKGLMGLLGIADRLHEDIGIRLVIAGSGALQDEVAAFAASRPWVDFRGQVKREQVCEVYDSFDVLAAPSLWPENIPGALVQALGNGTPPIGFDIGGTPEIIENDVSGFIVDLADFDAIATKIRALDADRAKLKAMSEAALVASKRYDDRVLRARLTDLVESMVSGSAAPSGEQQASVG